MSPDPPPRPWSLPLFPPRNVAVTTNGRVAVTTNGHAGEEAPGHLLRRDVEQQRELQQPADERVAPVAMRRGCSGRRGPASSVVPHRHRIRHVASFERDRWRYGERYVSALIGAGIHHNIKNVYTFICLNFGNREDEIYLIGFSRGAYTARCLAAFIGSVGLLTKAGLVHINTVYKRWAKNPAADDPVGASFELMLERMRLDKDLRRGISIEACAVWDTVSAIGLPRMITDMASYSMDINAVVQLLQPIPVVVPALDPSKFNKLAFVDKSMPKTLKYAFQALALNEMRTDFKPVLWPKPPVTTTVVKQCWFLGSHSDVGGGYPDAGLANLTLIWMIAQLHTNTNLGISDEALQGYLTLARLSNPKVEQWETTKQQRPNAVEVDEHEKTDGTCVLDTKDRQDNDDFEDVTESESRNGGDTENKQPGHSAKDDDKQEVNQIDQFDTDNDDVSNQATNHQDQVKTKKKKKGGLSWKRSGSRTKVIDPSLVDFLRPLLQEVRQPNRMYSYRAQAGQTVPTPQSE
ncbi:hypothetical protein MMC26_006663 [Xylographa opegraphella]|nr:hypothetical protein [Xylographa opegraphella]